MISCCVLFVVQLTHFSSRSPALILPNWIINWKFIIFQLCDEIKLKSEDLLKNLKHTDTLNQAYRVSSNSEKQFEEAKVPTPDVDDDLNLEKKSQELQASVKTESDLNALDLSSKAGEIENVEQVNDNSSESNGKSSG